MVFNAFSSFKDKQTIVSTWVVRAIVIKDINAITIVVMNPMSAVFATVIALAFGQEKFTFNLLFGALIIVAAIIISSCR